MPVQAPISKLVDEKPPKMAQGRSLSSSTGSGNLGKHSWIGTRVGYHEEVPVSVPVHVLYGTVLFLKGSLRDTYH